MSRWFGCFGYVVREDTAAVNYEFPEGADRPQRLEEVNG